MIEIDGPPRAYFEDSGGRKFAYKVYGAASEKPGDVIQAFAAWRAAYEDSSCVLVWRRRPILKFVDDEVSEIWADGTIVKNPEPKPFWKITCRCVKVPIDVFSPTLFEIAEGQPIPDLP